MTSEPAPKTSPTVAAMSRAIDEDLTGDASRYPERVAFVDADEPRAGREILAALSRGYAVALVSPDGREHVLTEQRPRA